MLAKSRSSKSSKILWYVRGIIVLIIGIVFMCSGIAQTSLMNKKAIDLDSSSYDWLDIKSGDHAKFTMSNCIGAFWEFTTNGHSSSKLYAYANSGNRVWNFDYVIGVKVSSSDYDEVDAIVDATERYLTTGKPINSSFVVDGRVRKMSEDEYDGLRSNLRRVGYSEEEIRELIMPYVIEFSSGGTDMLIIGGIFVAGAIALIVYAIIKTRKKGDDVPTLRVFD